MDKKFLVMGSWVDKTTGNPVTRIAEITSGLNKNPQLLSQLFYGGFIKLCAILLPDSLWSMRQQSIWKILF